MLLSTVYFLDGVHTVYVSKDTRLLFQTRDGFSRNCTTLRECCRLPLVGYYGPDDSPLVAPAGKNIGKFHRKALVRLHEFITVRWVMEICIQKAQWVELWPRSQHF